MEEKYRAEIEKKRAESVNRAWKIISVFVVVFQLLMLILMAAKPGGPFKTQRRTIYCICHDSESEFLEKGKEKLPSVSSC